MRFQFFEKNILSYNRSGEPYCIFEYREAIGCDILVLRDTIGTTTYYTKTLGGCTIVNLLMPERSMKMAIIIKRYNSPDFKMTMIGCL